MRIELIAIGDELLSGKVVNSNSAFISNELAKAGYGVARHTVLPDEEGRLCEGLSEALKRCDLVISTGGLGPTLDDITRKVIAALYGQQLSYDETIGNTLKMRYGENGSIDDQATIPSGATPLENPLGTAPGLVFEPSGKQQALLIALPGVPVEMEKMMCDQVIPLLAKRFDATERREVKSYYLCGISEGAVASTLQQIKNCYPTVTIGCYPSFATLAIHLSMAISADAAATLEAAGALLEVQYADNLFVSRSGNLAEAVRDLFTAKGWSLAVAESVTGGNIAAHLTSQPGASRYFRGSIVSYDNSVKVDLLKVSQQTISQYGAVSLEVVKEMALGLQSCCPSDIAAAISGIAGPDGGSLDKPVGTICAAIAHGGNIAAAWSFKRRGSRKMIIEGATNILMAKLVTVAKSSAIF